MTSKVDKVIIIAEIGVNHNGSMELAKELIDAAAEAGANYVKFQSFMTDTLVSKSAPKAAYQKKTTDEKESQYHMLKKLELTEENHFFLLDYCQARKIQFLSSPFDSSSLSLLVDKLNLDTIKIPSGEITNGPLLLDIGRSNKKIILSTGMSTLDEIYLALGVLAFGLLKIEKKPSVSEFKETYSLPEAQVILKDKVVLLHCTTQYPAPFEHVNLRAMDVMRESFSLPVGLSDHSDGISVPIAAVARGAAAIEKHFTFDKTLPGPDHQASLEPEEFKAMVIAIRQVESALGVRKKFVTPVEQENIKVARKSLVAIAPIKKGEKFTENNLAVMRPGEGLSPMHYWELIDNVSIKDFAVGALIR